jgi:hypothetical protein
MKIPLLLAVLLVLQDSELDRLIQQLGESDPARRDQAVRKLHEIGPRSRDALEKARRTADPEVRARANTLLETFEKERVQAELEAKERKKVFPRVTLDVVDRPRSEVLSELSRQTGWNWDPHKDVEMDERVTLKAKDAPLMEALERIGLAWSFNLWGKAVIGKRRSDPATMFADGIGVSFGRVAWKPGGNPTGTIFETEVRTAFDGEVRWSVASVNTDRPLTVETCAIHSPQKVYVPAADLAEPRVTVKGTRLWFCSTPIEFQDPRNGAFWRMGACQVSVEWPFIRVRMDNPMKVSLLTKTLTSKDIRFKAKVIRDHDMMGVGVGGGGGGRYGGRFGTKSAWCGCADRPSTTPPQSPPMDTELTVEVDFGKLYTIEQIQSISITFHKPVEDGFEVTSPGLK